MNAVDAASASGVLGAHAAHLLLAVPLVVFGVLVFVLARRPDPQERIAAAPLDQQTLQRDRHGHGRPPFMWLPALAAASALAAGIHGAVCPEHFGESALYGSFFLVLAAGQLAFAALILTRPSRRLLALGLGVNAVVVLLWLLTRTVAVPLGPAAGTTEKIGALDLVASVAEVGIMALCWLGLRMQPVQPVRRRGAWPAADARSPRDDLAAAAGAATARAAAG